MTKKNLADLLQEHMDKWGHGAQILADQANKWLEQADAPELPRANIENWRRGTAKSVSDWRWVAAIANVFLLNKEDANELLEAAGQPEIRELWHNATEKERTLLERWMKSFPPDQRQLPPEPFVDRWKEVVQLEKVLQRGRVVGICGPGGIGKSALAAESVWPLFPGRFPDGVVRYDFYDQPGSDLAFEHIARSFGEELGLGKPRDAARRALGKCPRALLILEGAENSKDLAAVLNIRCQCAVLVISRQRHDEIIELKYIPDVSPLPRDEAVKLSQTIGGDWAKDTTTCERICKLVGDLPLAVCLIGCYLKTYTVKEVADYLMRLEQGQFLEPLDIVFKLIEDSLTQVSEKARQVLALAGVLALAPFSQEAIAAAWANSFNVKQVVGELVKYELLRQVEQRYEVTHALIHTYAHSYLEVPAETFERLAAYYTQLAETETKAGLTGYGRLDSERRHIMAVLAESIKREAWHSTQRLARAVNQYFDFRGYTTEQVIALKQGLLAVQRLGCRTEEGEIWGSLGTVHRLLGQIKTAIQDYEQALAIAQEVEARRNEGVWNGNQGIAYRDLGKVEQAKEKHEEALAIAREVGDRYHEGYWWGQLGIDFRDGGEANQAIQYYEQALAIAQEVEDRRNEGYWLGNKGTAYLDHGREKEAIVCHNQALFIAREIGDRRAERMSLGYLGIAYSRSEKIETAIKYCEQALSIAREIGDHRGEAANLGNLGHIYKQQQELERATEYFQQALTINREVGNRRRESADLGGLGDVYREKGQKELAIDYYNQALIIAREVGDRLREALYRRNLGELDENSDPGR